VLLDFQGANSFLIRGTYRDGVHITDPLLALGVAVALPLELELAAVVAADSIEKASENSAVPNTL
jgi:hypothetical protein